MRNLDSHIERRHADLLLLAAAVALLRQSPAHQLRTMGAPVILLLLVDGGLVVATLEVVSLFALRPLARNLVEGRDSVRRTEM